MEIINLLPLIMFSALAFWKPSPPVFMLASGIALMTGLKWYDIYVNEQGLTVSLALIAYAFICFGFALATMFWTPPVKGGD